MEMGRAGLGEMELSGTLEQGGGDGGCAMDSKREQLINKRGRKEGKILGDRGELRETFAAEGL